MVAPEAEYESDNMTLAKCDKAEISNTHFVFTDLLIKYVSRYVPWSR